MLGWRHLSHFKTCFNSFKIFSVEISVIFCSNKIKRKNYKIFKCNWDVRYFNFTCFEFFFNFLNVCRRKLYTKKLTTLKIKCFYSDATLHYKDAIYVLVAYTESSDPLCHWQGFDSGGGLFFSSPPILPQPVQKDISFHIRVQKRLFLLKIVTFKIEFYIRIFKLLIRLFETGFLGNV